MKKLIAILFLIHFIVNPFFSQKGLSENGEPDFPMFWLLQDKQIEDHRLLEKELEDISNAGFQEVQVMLRATRYNLFDKEVINASKKISELCKDRGISFILGLDPRFGSTSIIRKTGYGAEFVMPIADYLTPVDQSGNIEGANLPERFLLNEVKIEDGRYDLKFRYPERRDTHILTEVGLWFNPISVEKVYAYQRKNGKVIHSSVTDITASHHLFINRSAYQVEVFGKKDMPPGEWYVIAFPRFVTNMYAYDSEEHKTIFEDLMIEYKDHGVEPDGLVWDEPGYYFSFGKFALSESIYQLFRDKYGYELEEELYALVLEMDDNSQLKVRNDYFNLLMDVVYKGEKECWKKAEELWGNMEMGAHQSWHNIVSDDMFHGTGSIWRGLYSIDGGYSDDGRFEEYFTGDIEQKYLKLSYVVLAKSLARYSLTGKANMNQWGVDYDDEVPLYWSQLLAAFSVNWINHSYGYTGTIYADRNFGPGYPEHQTWDVIPEVIQTAKSVESITDFNLPLGEAALVYPVGTYLTGDPIYGAQSEKKVLRLIGGLTAAGIQLDVISSEMLDTAKIAEGRLCIGPHSYEWVLLPDNRILSEHAVRLLDNLISQDGMVFFGGDLPEYTIEGDPINIDPEASFSLTGETEKTLKEIELLDLPMICGGLKGAYTNIIPAESEEEYFITVLPVKPRSKVGGEMIFDGQTIFIEKTKDLAVYKFSKEKKILTKLY